MATLTHYLPAADAIAIDDLIDKIARAERPTPRAGRGGLADGNPADGDSTDSAHGAHGEGGAGTGGGPDSDGDGAAGSADGTVLDGAGDGEVDTRTHLQRRSDALTRLILSPGNPAHPTSISATVLVTVPATTIAGVSDEPGDLHGYGPIDPDTARAIAATAPTFLRVLTRPVTGEPTIITRHRGRPTAGHPTSTRVSHPAANTTRPTTGPDRSTTGPSRATTGSGTTHPATAATRTGAGAGTTRPTPRAAAINEANTTTGAIHPAAATVEPTTTTATATATATGGDGHNQGGRDRYSASPEMRVVLAAIDQTCRFPGCGRRANRCELDHTRDWAHGGATTPENLAYLCSRHHHLKHDTRWSVEPDPDRPRHLNWRSPHGREYTTAPPRPPTNE